ncbi:MAG: glycosyltransferase family 4 protein [Syntrophaceae bacterium]
MSINEGRRVRTHKHQALSGPSTRLRPLRRERNLPLKVCLLSYRGNPTSGGQGVYIRRISRALSDLGHSVDVLSGPPYPHLDPDITLHKLPGLDLYNPDALFRKPSIKELTSPINTLEWLSAASGGFPEPLAFSLRALTFMHRNGHRYDVIHDNQCLAYGLLGIQSMIPTVATIHHPITKDRDISIRAASTLSKKINIRRWYHFLAMQKRVSRRISNLITVSEASRADISKDFAIDNRRFHVVANGINTEIFHPVPGVKRPENRLIVTNSADTPLKGLRFLMLAMAELRRSRDVNLTVIGKPKSGGVIERLVGELELTSAVTFTGRIDERDFARYYATSTLAVVPSLYEGFGLPAGEAMACGVSVVSTTGGALPEVVGNAGVLVPPGDAHALAAAIADLLESPDKRQALGQAGYERVIRNFTWCRCAEKTAEVYGKAIDAHAH